MQSEAGLVNLVTSFMYINFKYLLFAYLSPSFFFFFSLSTSIDHIPKLDIFVPTFLKLHLICSSKSITLKKLKKNFFYHFSFFLSVFGLHIFLIIRFFLVCCCGESFHWLLFLHPPPHLHIQNPYQNITFLYTFS